MRKSRINPISDKRKAKNKEWAKVKAERQEYLYDRFGFNICEYCGKAGHVEYDPEDIAWLSNHHRDGNRNNNTPDNAYICH